VTEHQQQKPWRIGPTGVKVLVHVTPRARREGVEGVVATAQGVALKVRVRAPADKGKANRAVEEVLSRWLGLANASIRVSTGTKSRVKTLEILGEAAGLEALVAARLGELA
jgi:uncharacterized protein